MARNEQLIRQHKILQILEDYRFGRTLEELRDDLVEMLGLGTLHPRSVRRDIEALQAAGFDINTDDSSRGKLWKFGSRNKNIFKITASATELIALSLSRDLLYPLAGTPFWQGIESFWTKMQEEMPASVWDHYEEYRQVLYVRGTPAKSYQKQHGILSTLHRAIMEHRVVEIEYQSLGKDPAKRKIEPLAVMFHQSSLYIIAAAHELPVTAAERIRHWKLDRFLKADALDKWYTPDPNFDLKTHVGASLGIFAGKRTYDFKIHISQFAARWVQEDPWHADQHIETHDNGSITLTVKATHELEIIPRVLALGAEAEILSPMSCRKKIAELIAKMHAKYQATDNQ
jgi:predicted DNA-binding transcriptional regulator YafY